MFRFTVIFTWARTLGAALLAALMTRPAAALLDTPKVRLFTNDVAFGPSTAVGAFTEATFPGYAAVTLTALAGPVNIGDNVIGMLGTASFIMTSDPGDGETIKGYYVTKGDGTVLYGAETFADPVGVATAGDGVILDVVMPMDLMQELAS